MTATPDNPTAHPQGPDFDREKWAADLKLRGREVAVKEREQTTREEDLKLRQAEHAASRWRSPVVVAIFAAAVAAAGNAVIAFLNGQSQSQLENLRAYP
jgi:hypothetical protein